MYVATTRHGYCDTCTHIRAVHGPTGDPRHQPCECCEPTGDTMTDTTDLDGVIAERDALEETADQLRATVDRNAYALADAHNELNALRSGIERLAQAYIEEAGDYVPPLPDGTAYNLMLDHSEHLRALLTAPVPDVTFDNPVTVQGETR